MRALPREAAAPFSVCGSCLPAVLPLKVAAVSCARSPHPAHGVSASVLSPCPNNRSAARSQARAAAAAQLWTGCLVRPGGGDDAAARPVWACRAGGQLSAGEGHVLAAQTGRAADGSSPVLLQQLEVAAVVCSACLPGLVPAPGFTPLASHPAWIAGTTSHGCWSRRGSCRCVCVCVCCGAAATVPGATLAAAAPR